MARVVPNALPDPPPAVSLSLPAPSRRDFLRRGSAVLLAAGLTPAALADLAASATPAP